MRTSRAPLLLVHLLLLAACSDGGGLVAPPVVTPPPQVDLSGSYPLVNGFMVGDAAISGALTQSALCPGGSPTGRLQARSGRAEVREGRITVTHETELVCDGASVSVTTHEAETAQFQLVQTTQLEFSPVPPATGTRLVRGSYSQSGSIRQISVHFRGRHDDANELVYGLTFRW